MIDFFQKVRPESAMAYGSTALFCQTTYTISAHGVTPCMPRIVKIDSTRPLTADGFMLARIGAMGNAIAQTDNLPAGVISIPRLND